MVDGRSVQGNGPISCLILTLIPLISTQLDTKVYYPLVVAKIMSFTVVSGGELNPRGGCPMVAENEVGHRWFPPDQTHEFHSRFQLQFSYVEYVKVDSSDPWKSISKS